MSFGLGGGYALGRTGWLVEHQEMGRERKDIKIMFQFHLCNKHASGMSLKCR